MKCMKLTSDKIDDKGFTLIEVLIAMVIFAMGILAVAQMQIRALKGDKDAFVQTEAAMWASNQAENLIGLPFANAALINTGGNFTDPPVPADPENLYNLSWRITDNLDGAGAPESKTIEILVEWTEKDVQKNLTFEYIKGRPIL